MKRITDKEIIELLEELLDDLTLVSYKVDRAENKWSVRGNSYISKCWLLLCKDFEKVNSDTFKEVREFSRLIIELGALKSMLEKEIGSKEKSTKEIRYRLRYIKGYCGDLISFVEDRINYIERRIAREERKIKKLEESELIDELVSIEYREL